VLLQEKKEGKSSHLALDAVEMIWLIPRKRELDKLSSPD
jgi:hypothetical protein